MLTRTEKIIDEKNVIGFSVEYDCIVNNCLMLFGVTKIIKIAIKNNNDIIITEIEYADNLYNR